jgi:predicted LPLAT superfamily acyltransferase
MQLLDTLVRRYAERLEILCRAQPLQWFNFFPFWNTQSETAVSKADPEADRP